jgi:hypothetical protein
MPRVLSDEEIEQLEEHAPTWERRAWVRKLGASIWVKLPLEVDGARDPDWDAYYRFAERDGHPTLAEVRLLARPRTRAEDRALRKALRDGGNPTPAREPTAKALRSISPASAHHYLRVGGGMKAEGVLDEFPEEVLEHNHATRRRGGAHGPEHYAEVAALFEKAFDRNPRAPIVEISKMKGWPRHYARDQVGKARDKGYLTSPGQGRIGGTMTDEARRILREAA